MYKRMLAHEAWIAQTLDAAKSDTDWAHLRQEHLVQLSFFQHERLIHLLVTLAFALMELGCTLATLITKELMCAVLMLVLLLPLVPYVVHYYHLENGCQRLYVQYDEIAGRVRPGSHEEGGCS